jgi:hypothetical protein
MRTEQLTATSAPPRFGRDELEGGTNANPIASGVSVGADPTYLGPGRRRRTPVTGGIVGSPPVQGDEASGIECGRKREKPRESQCLKSCPLPTLRDYD